MDDDEAGQPFCLGEAVWFLADRDALEVDEEARTVALDTGKASFFGLELDGKPCVLMFTDEDLANRFIAANGMDAAAVQVPSRTGLALFLLGSLPGECTHVAFDPSDDGSRAQAVMTREEAARLGG